MAEKNGTTTDIVTKYNDLISHVQGLFLEKEEAVKCIYMAMAIGEHAVVFGPPGNAKSKTINTILNSIKGANIYKRLISEDLIPKDLVGQIDLKKAMAENGTESVYEHNTKGYLPWAHFASLEEGFNGNSFTLNALNMICNEREFNNGGKLIQVPLITAIIPTNYEPEDAIKAFYDRFLFRMVYGDFQTKRSFRKFISQDEPRSSAFSIPDHLKVSIPELISLKGKADRLTVSKGAIDSIVSIREKIINTWGYYISPRRWDAAKRAMKIQAVLDNVDEVGPNQVMVLKHILWDKRSQQDDICKVIEDMADPYAAEYRKTRKLFESMKKAHKQQIDALPEDEKTGLTKTRINMEAIVKVRNLLEEVNKLKTNSPELGALYKEIEDYKKELKLNAI